MALPAGIAGTGFIGKVHTRSLRRAARAFDSAVRGGALPEGTPTFADGLRAALVTEALLVSSRSGQWVDVEPVRELQAVAS